MVPFLLISLPKQKTMVELRQPAIIKNLQLPLIIPNKQRVFQTISVKSDHKLLHENTRPNQQ
jgi:hypothetical protein